MFGFGFVFCGGGGAVIRRVTVPGGSLRGGVGGFILECLGLDLPDDLDDLESLECFR